MKWIKKLIVAMVMLSSMLHAFEIDPFDPNASLTENFSTNCLQMTQSQQILKAYIMVGLDSNFQNPAGNLKRAIVAYDHRAHQVHDYFHKLLGVENSAAKAAFDEALQLWEASKHLLEQPPTQENALIIKANFQKMITKLLEGTKPLATPELELISLTGKLCRKPIEITIDYLLRIWGVTLPHYEEEIASIISQYHANLKTLSANPLNNAQSLQLLQKAKRQFLFFEIMYRSKTHFIPNLLSKKADDNFHIIRQIKKIYKAKAQKRE